MPPSGTPFPPHRAALVLLLAGSLAWAKVAWIPPSLDGAQSGPAMEDVAEDAVPGMRLAAGSWDWPGTGLMETVNCVGYVEDDPALGELDHKWIVGDATGLLAISNQGKVHRLPGLTRLISALAVGPGQGVAGFPLHAVLAQEWPPDREHPSPRSVVGALEPGGTFKPLAGQGPDGQPDGTFGEITGLALRGDGSVWVADRTHRTIRAIAPDGRVTLVAGEAGASGPSVGVDARPLEGTGAHATFRQLRGMTQNLATGEVYVLDGNAVRRIEPTGKVSTLLGVWDQSGFDPHPSGMIVPEHVPCLNDPYGLQYLAGRLYLADTGNHAIRIFDLGSRVLATLLGAPAQATNRPGPSRLFSPGRAPETCAAVLWPLSLGVNAAGSCRVGLSFGLAEVEVQPLIHLAARVGGPSSIPCPAPGCPAVLRSKRGLAGHLLTSHSEARPWLCPIPGCGTTHKLRRHLQAHLRNFHQLSPEAVRRLCPPKRGLEAQPATGSSSGTRDSDGQPPLKRGRTSPPGQDQDPF